MTKATGVGRGGKRPGAGRKPPKAEPFENPANQTDLSAEDILHRSANALFAAGLYAAASQAAKRLADVQRGKGAQPGKKLQALSTAQAATAPGSRFAPPPPPGKAN